ncbi:MAG: hypothetical protein HUJ31_15805 [Pseudomonadales bacterium]|nr:hypothetical protein [Pseudomonadales bacterium]
MMLWFEKAYPYVLGAIGTLVLWESGVDLPDKEALLSATLGVSGIFVGFLATSKAILISLKSPIKDDLKQSNYIENLVSYIGEAIWVNLTFCFVNVVGFFIDSFVIYQHFWFFLAIASLISFVRVTHIMLIIFRQS